MGEVPNELMELAKGKAKEVVKEMNIMDMVGEMSVGKKTKEMGEDKNAKEIIIKNTNEEP
jgi:phage-related protein